MMPRTLPALAVAGLFLTIATPTSAQDVMRSAFHDYNVETVVDGLEHPWSIAFLPDGDMLVTEKPGRLRIIRDGMLLPDEVGGIPTVEDRGQGGLLDVVPHPDFSSNRLLYLSYSKPDPSDTESRGTTAVIRGRFENGQLNDVEEIFLAVSQGRGHYGSRLAFDGSGYLFISVGDRQAPSRGDLTIHPAQDLTNHHGTINRIHEDGRVPTDNPFVNEPGAQPEIWSYGHRNPQGLVIHPETGEIFANEHGPQGGDEVNHIRPGLNFGWPVIGYGVNYGSGTTIHEGTAHDGMEHSAHVWVPSIATSGAMIYAGDRFPAWRGNLFVGGMRGEQLARLTMEGNEIVREETLLQGLGRVRDVRQGPDGYIYVAIDGDGNQRTPILRLSPATDR